MTFKNRYIRFLRVYFEAQYNFHVDFFEIESVAVSTVKIGNERTFTTVEFVIGVKSHLTAKLTSIPLD